MLLSALSNAGLVLFVFVSCFTWQPKLVLNNIEILKSAVQTDDSTVSASMYHDNLVWRIIALGANDRCLPVLFVTSDRLVQFFLCLFGFYKYKLLLSDDCLVS